MHTVLEMFSQLIQSGKDVFIDQNTKLKVYTFSPPNIVGAGKCFFTANMSEFLKEAKSIVEIKNDKNNMCFAFAYVLGVAHLKEDQSQYRNFVKQNSKVTGDRNWTQLAVDLHTTVLGLDVQSMATWREFKFLEQYQSIGIHIYNISGVRPHFTYHTSRSLGFTKQLYFLQIGHHVHYISNITGLIRKFTRNNKSQYCDQCFKIYRKDRLESSGGEHVCEDENDDEVVDKQLCTIGNRTFPYFPKIGIAPSTAPQFLEQTSPKDPCDKKIIYLDFETTVVGYSHFENEGHRAREPPIPQQNLPVSPLDRYEPYPFVPREMNTSEYEYIQTVNHCEAQYASGEVFMFKSIEQTMEWLNKKENKGALLIAHCGGSFDFQLILRQFLVSGQLRLKKVKNPLLRGNKIISAQIQNNIKLIDSYAFVASALSKFPQIFNIEEEKKGFFPHLFNRIEFDRYKGSIPSAEWYNPDLFTPDKRREFYEWYEEQVANEVLFDFQTEMISYCHSDVQLLRLGMEKFRELFLTLTKEDGTYIGVDPYNHLTIPSVAFEGIYMRYFLPPQTLITVPRPTEENHSFKQILWLEYVMSQNEGFVAHARNGGEVEVTVNNGKKFKLDGYCYTTNTAYEFLGCYYHGCPYCYEGEGASHRFRKYVNTKGKEVVVPIKFGELYTYTYQRSEWVGEAGYKLLEMWECQWDVDVKKMGINTKRPDLEHHKPLIPRNAYFGGRVNAVKLYYKCTGDEQIKYLDITSMYPYTMSAPQYFYPIKAPRIFKKGRDVMLPIEDLFGLVKCKICPPRELLFPVLPERSVDSCKVVFHLNEMVGTWTSVEVQRAVEQGYVLLDVYEQHHFEEKSNALFREYNETFFAIKRRAKEEGNKGLEAIAKLCINGPTGKWGFNPEKQKSTRLVTECDDFYRYLCGSWEKVGINIITDEAATVSVEENTSYTEHNRSNVYISAFITAYSRLKLFDEALNPLQQSVLYFDTDSVIYVSPTGADLIPVDTTGQMGLWTSEIEEGDCFVEFVSCGPKTYALKSRSGNRDISKSKGFSLHYSNQQVFNFESLKEQVLYKALSEDLDIMDFEERMFRQNKKARLEKLTLHLNETIMRRKKFQVMVEQNRGKVINVTYDKRKILNPDMDFNEVTMIDTRPWGHNDIHAYMYKIQNI